jgi:hypothetical protein
MLRVSRRKYEPRMVVGAEMHWDVHRIWPLCIHIDCLVRRNATAALRWVAVSRQHHRPQPALRSQWSSHKCHGNDGHCCATSRQQQATSALNRRTHLAQVPLSIDCKPMLVELHSIESRSPHNFSLRSTGVSAVQSNASDPRCNERNPRYGWSPCDYTTQMRCGRQQKPLPS